VKRPGLRLSRVLRQAWQLSEPRYRDPVFSLRVFVSYEVLFAISVTLSSTSSVVCPRIPCSVRAFPEITGPFRLATEVHTPMELIPYRASGCLLAVQPVGWTDSPEISRPFNGVPRASPAWNGLSPPLRFRSQVFSTSQRFPGKLEIRGLVSCRNRSWDSFLPSEVSPHRRSHAPSGGMTGSLAVIH